MDTSKQVPGISNNTAGEVLPDPSAMLNGAPDTAPPLPPPPPPVDTVVRASTDAKELTAYLYIDPPQNGGAAPTLSMMQDALNKTGITYNIDTEKLNELEKAPVYNRYIQVAAGIAPVDGANGTANFKIRTEKSTAAPKIRQDGSVDFFDLDLVENVSKGQVLCLITYPTEGTPGMSVKGRELKQTKGRPVPSYAGSNTELTEDGTAIVSKINGQASFAGYRIQVNETLFVRGNIDSSTGNIKVVGNLVVSGMIMPGFKIEAGGDIEVRGIAESSTIKAGGNIKLQAGIIGSEITCDGDVRGRFIENCDLFVKGDITAEYIVGSAVKCGKNIRTMGNKAKIIGGSLMAGQNIEARVIGSPVGIQTRLEIGTDPTVIKRQQELTARIAELEKSVKSLKPLITMLRQLEGTGRLTKDKREILDNVGYSYDTNTKLLEESKTELEEIMESIKIRGFGRVICNEVIHPGTVVVIGGALLTVKEELSFVALYYEDGEIKRGMAR
jgi:uncharacterized protein (DUF342 family)